MKILLDIKNKLFKSDSTSGGTMKPNDTQKFPDNQKDPFGPNQRAWIDERYGRAFFRTPDGPMVKAGAAHD